MACNKFETVENNDGGLSMVSLVSGKLYRKS